MGKKMSLSEVFVAVRGRARKSLKEIFDLLEADLNWKWDDQGQSLGPDYNRKHPDEPRAAKGPTGSKFTTSKDFEPKAEPAKAPAGKPVTFKSLIPMPREGNGADVAYAKANGFKKITAWLVNPEHWDGPKSGAGPNDKESINWEGSDWLKPKSPQAKEVARIIKLDKLRPVDVVKPEVWKKHFEHKFGGQDK